MSDRIAIGQFVFSLSLLVLIVILVVRVDNAEDKSNLTNEMLVGCATAIENGAYSPDMWKQCIDDYLVSGGQ